MAKYELSALQMDFLSAFFSREDRFFLTGGAALVGFYLRHRETHDLDLFTLEDAMIEGMAAVAEVQMLEDKPRVNGIRVDPPQEILANKLCALLARSEVRDLVDVRALELAGYRVEDALGAAAAKDSGLTPAQLAWVLSEIELSDDLRPPGGVLVAELRHYLTELIARLTLTAFPKS